MAGHSVTRARRQAEQRVAAEAVLAGAFIPRNGVALDRGSDPREIIADLIERELNQRQYWEEKVQEQIDKGHDLYTYSVHRGEQMPTLILRELNASAARLGVLAREAQKLGVERWRVELSQYSLEAQVKAHGEVMQEMGLTQEQQKRAREMLRGKLEALKAPQSLAA